MSRRSLLQLLWASAASVVQLSLPAVAQTVLDGDTIRVGGRIHRIWSVDAPGTQQRCGDYPAGIVATNALQMLVSMGKAVTCDPVRVDRSRTRDQQ